MPFYNGHDRFFFLCQLLLPALSKEKFNLVTLGSAVASVDLYRISLVLLTS